jgi:hypothetical protein
MKATVAVVKLINKRAVAGFITRLIKVRAHRREPLNEAADALVSAAAESDSAMSVGIELVPEEVHFLWKEVGRPSPAGPGSKSCRPVLPSRSQLPKALAGRRRGLAPTIPLMDALAKSGRDTLGRVPGEMRIFMAKKQVLQSIAGAFP